MMSSKDRVGQIIKAFITVVRLIRGTCDAIGPAQLTNGLITLHVIDKMLDVNLHDWTPVRDRKMGWRQYTPSSNATTLESKKSVSTFGGFFSMVLPRAGAAADAQCAGLRQGVTIRPRLPYRLLRLKTQVLKGPFSPVLRCSELARRRTSTLETQEGPVRAEPATSTLDDGYGLLCWYLAWPSPSEGRFSGQVKLL